MISVRSWTACVAIAILGLLFGCERRPDEASRNDAQAGSSRRPAPVGASPAEERAVFTTGLEVSGDILAFEQVDVYSRIPGRLEELHVRQGDRVEKFQHIAEVERKTIEAQLHAADAAVIVAESQARAVAAGLDRATIEVERMRALFEQGSTTRQVLDGAEAAHLTALAQKNLAEAQTRQARAMREQVRIQLDECSLRSPIEGVVIQDFDRVVGEMIQIQAPVLRIAELAQVRVVVPISERYLGSVSSGQRATVRVLAHSGREFDGMVHRVGYSVDARTRTVPVEIVIQNPSEDGRHLLLPGMFARAVIETARAEDVVVVRSGAVQTSDAGHYVMVASEGRARRVPVERVLASDREVAVRARLLDGDMVIYSGAEALVEGDPVDLGGAR